MIPNEILAVKELGVECVILGTRCLKKAPAGCDWVFGRWNLRQILNVILIVLIVLIILHRSICFIIGVGRKSFGGGWRGRHFMQCCLMYIWRELVSGESLYM